MNSTPIRLRGAVFRGTVAALLTGLIAVSVGGCGQRGPLYLPEAAPTAGAPDEARNSTKETAASGDGETDDSADREDSR